MMKFYKKLIKRIFNFFGLQILKNNNNLTLDIHLKHLIELNQIDCVLDVGANVGQFGLMLRDLGYKGKIISFEPVQRSYKQLSSIKDSNWDRYNYGLGDIRETKKINVYKSDLFTSFHSSSKYGLKRFKDELSEFTIEEVEVYLLDDILLKYAGYKNIFLKMDTQGFDLNVFRGVVKNINLIKILMSEISFYKIYDGMPDYLETLKLYRENNYHITGLFPMNTNADSTIVEMDAVLVRSS